MSVSVAILLQRALAEGTCAGEQAGRVALVVTHDGTIAVVLPNDVLGLHPLVRLAAGAVRLVLVRRRALLRVAVEHGHALSGVGSIEPRVVTLPWPLRKHPLLLLDVPEPLGEDRVVVVVVVFRRRGGDRLLYMLLLLLLLLLSRDEIASAAAEERA
jgi:hypothetical protein